MPHAHCPELIHFNFKDRFLICKLLLGSAALSLRLLLRGKLLLGSTAVSIGLPLLCCLLLGNSLLLSLALRCDTLLLLCLFLLLKLAPLALGISLP